MANMAVTITEKVDQGVKEISFAWLSDDAAGTATATTDNAYDGQVLALITNPGAAAPTADYDITVTDTDGYDVLNGEGTDRHTTNTEVVVHGQADNTHFLPVAKSKLTLNVSAAGNAKAGVCILRIR